MTRPDAARPSAERLAEIRAMRRYAQTFSIIGFVVMVAMAQGRGGGE